MKNKQHNAVFLILQKNLTSSQPSKKRCDRKEKNNELLSHFSHTDIFVSYFISKTPDANSWRNKVSGFLAQQYREVLRRVEEDNQNSQMILKLYAFKKNL